MTQKRIFILVAILLASLLLAACGPNGIVKQANPETKELVVTAWAMNGGTTMLTVTVAADEELTTSAGNVTWIYDVPAHQVEYVFLQDNFFTLHLHEEKNPK